MRFLTEKYWFSKYVHPKIIGQMEKKKMVYASREDNCLEPLRMRNLLQKPLSIKKKTTKWLNTQ